MCFFNNFDKKKNCQYLGKKKLDFYHRMKCICCITMMLIVNEFMSSAISWNFDQILLSVHMNFALNYNTVTVKQC